MQDIAYAVKKIVGEVIEESGLELYEIDWRPDRVSTLRIVVERKDREGGGVTTDELAALSREIGRLLDLEEPIRAAYRLTVESPGVERALRRPSHFRHAVGERVKVICYGGEVSEGVLRHSDDSGIELEDGVRIAYEEIKHAHTKYIWPDTGKPAKKSK